MAPLLDAGIFHHADMDRHTDSHQGNGGSPAHHTDSVKALKAVHELLNKLFSKGTTPSTTDSRKLDKGALDGLAKEAFLVFSKAAALTPPSSPGQRPQTIDTAQQHQLQQQQISIAKTPAVPDDLESRPILDAIKYLAPPHSFFDGSRSLSSSVEETCLTTNGAEYAAKVPEAKQPDRDITTPNHPPENTNVPALAEGVSGAPEANLAAATAAAKDRSITSKSTHNATSRIHHRHYQQEAGTAVSQSETSTTGKPDRLRELAETISRHVEALSSSASAALPSNGPEPREAKNGDDSEDAAATARIQLVSAANELLDKVRPAPDVIMGWFAQMSVVSAVNVFLHWGVFDLIPAENGAVVLFRELADKVGAEEGLLIRMAWMLTSSSVLRYHPPSTGTASPDSDKGHGGGVSHTPTSLLLRTGSPLSSMFQLLHTNIVETSSILPPYFDAYGRREPVGPAHIPTTYLAGQPDLSYFELLNQDPVRTRRFMHAMSIQHRRSPVTGMFELNEVILLAERRMERTATAAEGEEGSRPPPAVWVDIGGSDGAVVKTFRGAYPALRAEWCVVQDLPEVVDAAREAARDDPLLEGVRFCPLDFHNEAPVEGALVYYLRHVVRDYSDPVVINILSNIRKSMIPPSSSCSTDLETAAQAASSRILISEQLIPSPPPFYAAFKDYAMLAVGGKERSLEQFEAVAEAAGLMVTAVYRDKGTPHAVIEMRVKV